MKMKYSLIFLIIVLAGCSDLQRFSDRNSYQGYAGPELRNDLSALRNIRRFSPTNVSKHINDQPDAERTALVAIADDEMLATRAAVFAHVDIECSKYIDAIFWAGRAQKASTTSLGLAGAATSTILAASGVGTAAIAITAAAFGLSASFADTYYDSFLYSLEPSGVVGLIDEARATYRAEIGPITPQSEGDLLNQTQGYIQQCAPPHIEALVNEAIAVGEVTAKTERAAEPLSLDEQSQLDALMARPDMSLSEARRLTSLVNRLHDGGVLTDQDIQADFDPDASAAFKAFAAVPVTRIKSRNE